MAATDRSMSSNPSSFADDERQRGKEDEWSEVESAERCCYTSNCECWVSFDPPGSGVEARERRKAADPLGRRGRPLSLSFVPHGNTPELKLLGTFRETLPWNFEYWDYPTWYDYLDIPGDDMTYIPPPPPPPPPSSGASPPAATSTMLLPLPLFSLTRFLRVPVAVDDNGERLAPGEYAGVGMSFSLPLHPPPSKLIPSHQHPLPTNVLGAKMIGSCNGLYCLLSGPGCSVIVWNPSTGASRLLPRQLPSHPYDGDYFTFGFGYDQSSDDYKVVRINENTLLVEVFCLYSSNNSSWRTVEGFHRDRPCSFQRYFYNGAVSFAGCLNWLVCDDGHTPVLASFDLATESFRFLPPPPTYQTGVNCLLRSSLSIMEGCLSFVTLGDLSRDCGLSVFTCRSRVFDIWIMREYGVASSWTNAATIAFPYSVDSNYRILYLSKDVLILDVLLQYSRLFVFNLKENSLVCPHIRGATNRHGGVEPYVQTQVSPYGRSSGRGRQAGEEGEYSNKGQLLLKDEFYQQNEPVLASSPGNGIVVCTPSYSKIDGLCVEISYPWANDNEPGRRLMILEGIDQARLVAPSINGLICVTDFAPRPTLLLCNPTTGKSLTLLVPPACPWSFYKFGFGYSPSTDEYKFVQLCLKRDLEWLERNEEDVSSRVIDCRVLTLRLSGPHDQQRQQRSTTTTDDIDSSPWRRIEHPFGHDYVIVDGTNSGSVYVDGVIYWSGFTITSRSHRRRTPRNFILSFHVRDEIFTTFPPPPPPLTRPDHPDRSTYLIELQGRLAVGRLTKQSRFDYELDVWSLMGAGNWVKQLQIGFNVKELGFDYHAQRCCPFFFDFSCLCRDKFIVILCDTWLIYDLESDSFVTRLVDFDWYATGRPVSSPI